MLKSLLYVSRSRLDSLQSAVQVADIVGSARPRNESLGVTGALIFTEASFAQVIEGSGAALDELMGSILKDTRHDDIRIVSICEIEEIRFGQWWMAYSGPSFYVNRHIKPLLTGRMKESDIGARAERLIALMLEFTATGESPLLPNHDLE